MTYSAVNQCINESTSLLELRQL